MAADEAARAEVPEARGSIARRIGRNIGIVVTGNAAVAGFGVITLALNARALGTAGLGVLALIMTIATLVDRIAAFQTWLPLVKLGAEALAAGDKRRVGQIVTVALLFDAIAATASAVVAVLIVLLAGQRLGIPAEYLGVAGIYMAMLVTRIADTPSGVMRLFDRFGLLTTLRAGEAAAHCLAAAVLFAAEAPLAVYVLTFAGVEVASNIVILAFAQSVAVRNGAAPAVRGIVKAWSETWHEFWAFSWAMSLSGTIAVVRDRAPLLLIGALFGPTAVGLYYVAERVAGVLSLAMAAVNHVLYPEIVRLAVSRRITDLNWLVVKTGTYLFAIGLVVLLSVIVVGPLLLRGIGGLDYTAAYLPLLILIGAHSVAMAGVALRIGVIVLAGPMQFLIANFIAFIGFAFAVTVGVTQFGIVGAAVAQVAFEVLAMMVALTVFTTSLLQPRGARCP
jgi:O-antigen/teichoic acid export membrane protein